MYNFMNFKMKISICKVIGSLVFIDVYYVLNLVFDSVDFFYFVMGCWEIIMVYGWFYVYGCCVFDFNDLNRERFF